MSAPRSLANDPYDSDKKKATLNQKGGRNQNIHT